jgi:hypothetical protein
MITYKDARKTYKIFRDDFSFHYVENIKKNNEDSAFLA